MDLTPAPPTAAAPNNKSPTPTTTPTTTTPETDTETPPTKSTDNFHRPSSSSTKLIPFTNGSFNPQYSHHHHHNQQLVIRRNPAPAAVVVVVYRECLKNHAASLGGHALDGCGEFMPSPSATSTDPTSLKCAACGCHRNFHRRDPDTQIVELHHHRHTTTTTSSSPRDQSPNSVSPPPISSTYNFPANSAPHILLALSAGHVSAVPSPPLLLDPTTTATVMTTATPITKSIPTPPLMMGISSNGGRKRFRTKFSQEQKDKMCSFSEKMGWKMQKRNESLVEEFCNEIGVRRGVLKVWMHNNKHTFGKSTTSTTTTTTTRDDHLDHDLDHHNHHHINLHKHHGRSSSTSTSHEDHGVTNGTGGSSSS